MIRFFSARIWVPALVFFGGFGLSPAFASSGDDGKAMVACAVGLGLGVYSFFKGFTQLRKKRLIEDIPTSTIRAMAPGQVEVTGQVLDWNLQEAPFTKQPCAYYEYKVEQLVSSGKNSHWETIKQDNTGPHPFCLQDETGRALILPTGAETIISDAYSLTTGLFTDIPDHINRFLELQGISCHTFFGFEKKMRFTERNFRPSETIYVLGVCQTSEGLSLEMPPGVVEQVCIGRGKRSGELFILSNESQKELESSMGWGAFGGVFGGVVLIGVCLYFILFLLQLAGTF